MCNSHMIQLCLSALSCSLFFCLRFLPPPHAYLNGQLGIWAQSTKPSGALFQDFSPKHSAVLTTLNSVFCHLTLERI